MKTISGFLGVAALVAVASVVLTVGACGPSKMCGPSNCSNGCCSEDGVCQTGLANNQCGLSGSLCKACGVTELCQAGLCIAFGNQNGGDGGTNTAVQNCLKTCQGCCNPQGECQPGTAVSACGVGETCKNCPTGNNCVSGTCVNPTCSTCTSSGQCDANGGPSNNSACGTGGAPCKVCSGGGASCQSGACVGSCTNGCTDSFGACKNGNTAGACGSSGSACVTCPSGNVCVNGACQLPPMDGGSCKSAGAACVVNQECCNNTCDGTGHCATTDAGSCKGTDAKCVLNAECCSNNCQSGFCLPKTDGGSCKSDGAQCLVGSECCSFTCNGGICGTPTNCAQSCPSGCCNGNTCMPGTSTAACGNFGNTCTACVPGQTCSTDPFGDRACQSPPADAGSCSGFNYSCASASDCCSASGGSLPSCVASKCAPNTTQNAVCKILGATCTSGSQCCSASCSGGVCAANGSGLASACLAGLDICSTTTSQVTLTGSGTTCDPCVAEICKMDSFCCTKWDGVCGQEAAASCTGRCP